jgi:hypothetical protein
MSNQTADRITVTVAGQPREIFMSFGILNALCAAVANVEQVGLILLDPTLRLGVLEVLLSPRDDKGKITEKFDLERDEMSSADAEIVLEWAGDHVLDFFMRAVETQSRLLTKNKDRVAKLSSIVSQAG